MSGTDDDVGGDSEAADHGFEVARRIDRRRDGTRSLRPADTVASQAYFAPDPGADLPVLSGDRELVFASENYLGLTQDDRVQTAAKRAIDTVGTGAGAPRHTSGDTLVHRDLEARLAETTGTVRALAFASAYEAAVGAITALDPAVLFVDARTPAGLVDGGRLADAAIVEYAHCDRDALADALETCDREGSWLVASPSVFPVDGAIPDLAGVCDVADRHGAWVLVDESHATGVYADGAGVVARDDVGDRVDVQIGSLATALASQGGYVAGNKPLIELLTSEARSFQWTTGLAPASAAAASEALHIARHGAVRSRLWENVTQLREGLRDAGFDANGASQIVSLTIGDTADAIALADAIRDRGVLATPVYPPLTPTGAATLRLTPMATHDRVDIEDCIHAVRDAANALDAD